MIDVVREYMENCPYIDEFATVNVDYLVDKVNSYSVNESAGYDPVIDTYLNGTKEMIFKFNFDAKFYWNDEIQNNVDNSIFFENVRNWLKSNNDNNVFPDVDGIIPEEISAKTNGFIYITGADEAIYRISCEFKYIK